MTDDIAPTFEASRSEKVEGGVRHEKFELCTVDPDDITKIIKNEVEMIDSVGNQMYGHARTVFRMLEAACGDAEEAKKYCDTREGELVFHEQGFKQRFNDQKFKDMEGFDEFIERKWLQPIRDTVVLCNSTRVTLHQLLRNRFDYEKAFYLKPHPDEDETGAFVRSGGFIPLHWLSYMNRNYIQPISFFSDPSQLRLLRYLSYALYQKEAGANSLLHIILYGKFYDKSNQELNDIYGGDKLKGTQYLYDIYVRSHNDLQSIPNRVIKPIHKSVYGSFELERLLPSLPDVYSSDLLNYEEYAWRRGMELYFKRVAKVLSQLQGNKSYDTENQVFRLKNKDVPFSSQTTDEFMSGVKTFSFQRSTPQNKESSRCATVYQLVFKDGKLLTLIDLPGNEDQVLGCQSENDDTVLCTETLGIRELLNYVRTLMTVKRLNVTPDKMGIDYLSETFREVFEPLMDPMCKVGFLCFSANYAASPNYVPNTLATLNYMTGLAKSSYSCEDGVNEAYAARLIEEYAAQRKDDEAEMLKLFPPQATPRTPLRTLGVSDAVDVSDFKVPELPLLPPPLHGNRNEVDIERGANVFFRMTYTVKDPKKGRLYEYERFSYDFRCNGKLDVYANNACRFTDVTKTSFHRKKFTVDVKTHKQLREFQTNEEDKEYLTYNLGFQKTFFEDVIPLDVYDVYNVETLPGIFQDSELHHRIPIERNTFMNFQPPLVDIDISFDRTSSVVTITPKNKRNFESTDDAWMEKKVERQK